ncbi:hypothetical protein PR048_004897 [Dryococelus australis]|uniref:Uncharacterized protein n=1 Tax=Dryococelus australis TaxID=614101 RepID=A0ABQ9I6Q4_9NEOP|nr:hypothetical protein PR048_004897 [Dryococelus australis]
MEGNLNQPVVACGAVWAVRLPGRAEPQFMRKSAGEHTCMPAVDMQRVSVAFPSRSYPLASTLYPIDCDDSDDNDVARDNADNSADGGCGGGRGDVFQPPSPLDRPPITGTLDQPANSQSSYRVTKKNFATEVYELTLKRTHFLVILVLLLRGNDIFTKAGNMGV